MPAAELRVLASGTTRCPLLGLDGSGTLYEARGGQLLATRDGNAASWQHDFGQGHHIAALVGDPGEGGAAVIVVGADTQLERLSASGDVLWKRPLGRLKVASISVALSPSGAVAVLGVDPGAGRHVLSVLDAHGTVAFTRTWPGADSAQAVFTAEGQVAVAIHAPHEIRFMWLDARGETRAGHAWGVTAPSFLVQADDGDTLVAVANAPEPAGVPQAMMLHGYMGVFVPIFLRISSNGHVDYQLVPEQHLSGLVNIARVDALAVDPRGHVWFQGNMPDSFALGAFATYNEGLFNEDREEPIGNAICGRFLAVTDRQGEPIWAHALANLVPCDLRPVALLASPSSVVVAFNHRGDIAMHVDGEAPVAHAREGCRILRFTAVPPFDLGQRETAVTHIPDTNRHLGVLVDGHPVP